MTFEESYLYHIYNQGNNRQLVFFSQENYFFFLRKLKTYISPYADILAWCLMPNHFHLMVKVNCLGQEASHSGCDLESRPESNQPELPEPTFNHAIGRMLSSYTRAVNKEQGLSGSLFRKRTKAECINKPNGITPSFISEQGITKIKLSNPEKEYPQVCFDYIHQNPVKAGLSSNAHEWEYSSAMDYAGNRNGKLINKAVAKKYIQF